MKRKFLAVAMMVVMSASLVACSGKDASKENTTAGTNDSAVEATTGTTTQDVAKSNEETTTPDVSEVEEDQVGETSVGTVGGSAPEFKAQDITGMFEDVGYTNDLYSELGKVQVQIFKDDQSKGRHTIFWTPSEKWDYDKEIIVYFDAHMALSFGYNTRAYPNDDSSGFVTYNVTGKDEEILQEGFNKTTLTFTNLGDLSSNEAWQEQLNREWSNTNGEYIDVFSKNDNHIKIIKDCRESFAPLDTELVGYTAIYIDRLTGLEYTFTFTALEDEHFDDNEALEAVRSFGTARRSTN